MQPRTRKVLIVCGAAAAFLVVSWAVLLGAILTAGGIATVQFRDHTEGVGFYLPVPMAVISSAVSAVGVVAPLHADGLEVHGDVDLGEWAPFVEAVMEGLEECPDTTFVEVVDHGDLVRVSKHGGKLRVEVEDSDISLRVAVPIRPVRRTISGLLR